MKSLLILALLSFSLGAQTRVGGTASMGGALGPQTPSGGSSTVTSTQALISFSASTSATCTVEVSESATYSPLVHDVDSTLFTGAGVSSGGSGARVYVAGKRLTTLALDSNKYSRALQTNTLHYWRTTCAGPSVTTGTFTTSNIPVGSTYAEPPPADPATPGGWMLPTIDGTRTQSIVDPQTGALISPMSIPADHAGPGSYGLFIGDGGGTVHCNNMLQTASMTGAVGYLCVLWQENQGWGTLYFLVTATGETISLGLLHWSNPSIDSNMDLYCTGASSGDCFGGSTPGVTYLRHYQGDFTTQADADLASPVVYNSTSVGTLVHNFDATFDATLFGCSGINGGVGIYRAVECKRGNQNSFGWLAVFYTGDGRSPVPSSCSFGDTGCPRIVAADYSFTKPQTKFCGIHNTQLFQGQNFLPPVNTNMVMENWHDLDQGTANDGTAYIGATTVGSVIAGSTTITVDGAVHSFASMGEAASIPAVAPGDVFQIAGISFDYTLVSNVANVWTFTPALGDPVSNGTLVYMFCNSPRSVADGDWSISGWDFLTYPSGSTVVFDTAFPGGGHYGLGPLGRTTETSGGEGFYPFNGGTLASSLNNTGVEIDSTGTWNGVTTPGYGALLTKHPAYQNYTAAAQWFNDRMTFAGQPTDGSVVAYSDWPVGASNAISGTGGVLYQYASAPLYPLQRKKVATQASTGGASLRDISSPTTGNVLSANAADNYKYCVAYAVNECRTGATAGQIFFNVPSALAFPVCSGGDAPNTLNIDVCITNMPTYSGALMQWGMGTNSLTSQGKSRNITYGLAGVKDTFGFPVGKPTALGEYTLFTLGLGIGNGANAMDTWKVKMPPLPAPDAVDRTAFIQTAVALTSPGGTVTNAIIEFGYEENGTTTQYYCTSRAEACVAGTSLAPGTMPFAFPTDGTSNVETGLTGTACTTTCSINIPAISGHIVFGRALFRNSSNATVGSPVVLDPIAIQ